jgi:hypothetical protein
MSSLKSRLLVSAVCIPLLFWIVLWAPIAVLRWALAILSVIGAVEMLSQLHRMRLPRRTGESKDVVNRAKAVLMKQKGLSEPEAHRAMQQYAMNHGMKMADFAMRILEKSEEAQ